MAAYAHIWQNNVTREFSHTILTMPNKFAQHFTLIFRSKWKILILHSLISTEEQQLIFQPLESEKERKIILSTNIAESSITVPDVTYGKFQKCSQMF